MIDHVITYAQNREDLILSAFFDHDEIGFYVDIGANEPVHESVTKYFYDMGWSGINIEPLPHLYEKLQKARPRDINLALGVGSENGQATIHYYPNGDGLSTMSEEMAQSYDDAPTEFTAEAKEITIKIQTLKQILTTHLNGKTINFMKVDVEGFEYAVLASNDWEKFKPEVICIEANHVQRDWHKILLQHGYVLVFFDGLNEYYATRESNRAEKFNYVKAVIFREPIVNFRLLKDYDRFEKHIAWLDGIIAEQKKEVAEAQLRASQYQAQFEEIASVKRHLKKAVKHRLRKLDIRVTNKLSHNNTYTPESLSDHILASEADALLKSVAAIDSKNFKSFNTPHPNSALLKPYTKSKTSAVKVVKKINRQNKKQKNI